MEKLSKQSENGNESSGSEGEEEEEEDYETNTKENVVFRSSTVIARQQTTVIRVRYCHFLTFLKEESHKRLLEGYERVRTVLAQPSSTRSTQSINSVVSAVSHLKFFSSLSTSVVHKLCQIMMCSRHDPGHIVCRQGDPGETFYVILSGKVSIYVEPKRNHGNGTQPLSKSLLPDDEDERPESNTVMDLEKYPEKKVEDIFGRCVVRLSEGASFGEASILSDLPRTATCICSEATELMIIYREDYLKVFGNHKVNMVSDPNKVVKIAKKPQFKRTDEDLNTLVDLLNQIKFFGMLLLLLL